MCFVELCALGSRPSLIRVFVFLLIGNTLARAGLGASSLRSSPAPSSPLLRSPGWSGARVHPGEGSRGELTLRWLRRGNLSPVGDPLAPLPTVR